MNYHICAKYTKEETGSEIYSETRIVLRKLDRSFLSTNIPRPHLDIFFRDKTISLRAMTEESTYLIKLLSMINPVLNR